MGSVFASFKLQDLSDGGATFSFLFFLCSCYVFAQQYFVTRGHHHVFFQSCTDKSYTVARLSFLLVPRNSLPHVCLVPFHLFNSLPYNTNSSRCCFLPVVLFQVDAWSVWFWHTSTLESPSPCQTWSCLWIPVSKHWLGAQLTAAWETVFPLGHPPLKLTRGDRYTSPHIVLFIFWLLIQEASKLSKFTGNRNDLDLTAIKTGFSTLKIKKCAVPHCPGTAPYCRRMWTSRHLLHS